MRLIDTIAELLRSGPRTSGDLAEATGRRPASVRAVLNEMARHGEVEPGEVIRAGRRGRPGRGWRLLRVVLEIPFPQRSPATVEASPETRLVETGPTLAELLEAAPHLEDLDRRALLALAERARTPSELRELLELRNARAVRKLLAGLERRGLIAVIETRRPGRAEERLWELAPTFLIALGQGG